MRADFIQKLAASEQHLKHVALEMVAGYLAYEAERVVEVGMDGGPLDEEEQEEEDATFYDLLVKAVKKLSEDLEAQAESLAKACICFFPDDERVYPAVRALLKQLPLPRSSTFGRYYDEGYRLEVSGTVIFRGLSADDAIEATRRYVTARTMNPDLPTNTTDELN